LIGLVLFPRLASDWDPSTSASQVARITDMSYPGLYVWEIFLSQLLILSVIFITMNSWECCKEVKAL
jgi:hypothetical protein